MAKKILSIIDTAYRATFEEQDDTALWFSTACKGAGAEMTVLLTGNAVAYATTTQKPEGLSFGNAEIPHPPKLDEDLDRLMKKGGKVLLVREDAQDRGISPSDFMAGVEAIGREGISRLMDQHDLVWHW